MSGEDAFTRRNLYSATGSRSFGVSARQPAIQQHNGIRSKHPCCGRFAITIVLAFVAIAIVVSPAWSADKYERKSISYVPVAALLGDSVNVPQLERDIFAREVQIAFGRFDNNILPSAIASSYRQKAESRIGSIESLKSTIQATIAPKVLEILQECVIDRALEFVSETDEQMFITTKAKESGITVADLRAVMNSAFIGVPYIERFGSRIVDKHRRTFVKGGLAWFQVNCKDEKASVSFIGVVEHESSGSASTTETYLDSKGKTRTKRIPKNDVITRAMTRATNGVKERLKDKTKNLAPFQIVADIKTVNGSTFGIDLSADMDLSLDDKFYLAEYRKSADGTVEKKKVGFARVKRVGNGDGEMTIATVIKCASHLSPGMSVIEHPRFPLEMRYGGYYKQFIYRPGRLVIGNIEYLSVAGEEQQTGYAVGLGVAYNLARSTGISQFFINADALIGFHELEDDRALNGAVEAGGVIDVGGTITLYKKFGFGAFSAGFEAGVGGLYWYHRVNISDSTTFNVASISYKTGAFAGVGRFALEYALSIDFNLGIAADYWYGPPADKWTINVRRPGQKDGTDYDPDNDDVPELELTGLGFRLYLTHSIL